MANHRVGAGVDDRISLAFPGEAETTTETSVPICMAVSISIEVLPVVKQRGSLLPYCGARNGLALTVPRGYVIRCRGPAEISSPLDDRYRPGCPGWMAAALENTAVRMSSPKRRGGRARM